MWHHHTAPIPLHAPTLREWVLSQQHIQQPKPATTEKKPAATIPVPKTFKIVDVRDDDYYGGHISGALNVPSHEFPARVDSLVDELKDDEAVVFHCALSQIRGPAVLPSVKLTYDVGCKEVFE
jgi:Rhodanese-like domain